MRKTWLVVLAKRHGGWRRRSGKARTTGSFTPRGAIYALMKNIALRSRNHERPIKGVVAASTGNHGSAVAYASRLANIPATIFLPSSPNPIKRSRIVELGATVPMGDTALIRGVASEAKRRHPAVRIVGVQAVKAPSYVRSWQEGRVVAMETCDTIADGLATYVPLEPNVRAIRELVDDVCLVSEDEMVHAIGTLLYQEHIVAEPAGAATTAAYLKNSTTYAGRNVVLLVTGSNIPDELLRQAATF